MTKQNTAAAQPATDLRQRAARARDAAGRFISRTEPVEPPASRPEPDPVLALIEEHRAAYAEWDRLSDVWNEMLLSDPGYAEAMAASEEPGKREVAAYETLLMARPASLPGAAAWVAYLDEATCRTRIDAEPSDGERVLGTVAAVLKELASEEVPVPHPDAALFALGDQFMAAWAVEEEAPDGAGYWACNRLAQQIVQTPAVTAAGYGIKALLLARLDEDYSSPRKPAKAQGPLASHWNVLRQVQEGAALLAATPVMGIPISTAARPETGYPVTATPPLGPRLVDMLDLASATMDELRAIQDIAEHVGAAAYAYTWGPRCGTRGGRYGAVEPNDIGKLMHWLGDALTDVETAVDEEVARRAPANHADRETRLSMRAVTIIDDGDPETIRAFALELLDHAAAEFRGA
ncbi:hypothetical protein [Methylobacterium pseudosasicola]|uniref:Uncharacterized protein n=1 Tax=Methylobacterium pseudosasicola TaxID=582667 RepID=A0A1I4MS16_9HYPH|nr:hypothetical protein [Methylobacterium pseudosasicola]SFM06084.1 hypothetical protein SAMN05192568_10185 [Methylobacterium pseudosasicola]